MAIFNATGNPDNFTGTVGVDDTVRYDLNATTGITVNTLTQGSGGIAEGDTYTSIENFRLSNLSGEADTFLGSNAAENVVGLAGFNDMNGRGGNDRLVGGDEGNRFIGGNGRDTVIGGNGNDVFVVAAGEVTINEFMRGGGGTDRIVLAAGGTGSVIDLSIANIAEIEQLVFSGNTTARVTSTQLNDFQLIVGANRTGQVFEVADWSDMTADISTAIGLLQAGIDEVQWTFTDTAGLVSFVSQTVPGGTETEFVSTFNNNGATTPSIQTVQAFYNASGQLKETIQTDVNGLRTTSVFDPATGTLQSQTIFDLSANGDLEPFTFRFIDYDASGNIQSTTTEFDDGVTREELYVNGAVTVVSDTEDTADGGTTETIFDVSAGGTAELFSFQFVERDANGDLSFELTDFDTGITRERDFINGELSFILFTDNSTGSTAENYQTLEQIFTSDGAGGTFRSFESITFDAGETFLTQETFFAQNGALELRTSVRASDGVEIFVGSSSNQTFTATDADQVFVGRGGVDTFDFSGDVGRTVINDFDDAGADLLDLTSYGIDSRAALETAGALTYIASADRFIIDVSAIGGSGTIILNGIEDAELGAGDFVLGLG